MNPETAQEAGTVGLEALILLVLAGAGVAIWAWLFARPGRAAKIVPWQPRRAVPWVGVHVAVIVCLYLGALTSVPVFLAQFIPPPPKGANDGEVPSLDHPAARLMHSATDRATFLICLLSAVVAAPLCEEFVFRLVLQGWLEKRLLRRRRHTTYAAQALCRFPKAAHGVCGVPIGSVPVVMVAVLFASIHFRPASPPIDMATLQAFMLGNALANLFTLVAGICLLRLDAGATLDDLGISPGKLAADLKLGLLGLLAIGSVVYPLQFAMVYLFEKAGLGVAADPIALFVFALMLGVLYLRTHRIGPSIVAHMGLNLTSLMLARF